MKNNLFLGNNSLVINKKWNNRAIGIVSLSLNKNGVNNTAVGWKSLKNALLT